MLFNCFHIDYLLFIYILLFIVIFSIVIYYTFVIRLFVFVMPQLEIVNATGANMATTHVLQHIQLPERFELGQDPHKFLREMANYFAMVKLPISQQGVFFPAFLSPGIVDRFKKATKRGVGWEKTFESCFVEKASFH